MDTDPGGRKRNPEWLGIIPDMSRGSAFVVVFAMCALQVVAKAASAAILAVTSGPLLLGYTAADHALHLIYRVIRRDLIVFVPLPAAPSYIMSFIFRVVWKTLGDFTGAPLWRLPLLQGGAYWIFNFAVSQVSVFASVHLYNKYAHAPEGVDKMAADTLWAGAGLLGAAWLLTTTYFVFRIAVPKYRHTLWSWASGRQVIQDYFLKGADEETRFTVFTNNLLLWESDIGDEVKVWTAENWARWKEEKPAWFKPEVVPDQFIPAEELQQLGYNRRRRGSAAGSVRESLRESMREEEEEEQ
jgi:hypothetical protein